jgi:hypothetical protein
LGCCYLTVLGLSIWNYHASREGALFDEAGGWPPHSCYSFLLSQMRGGNWPFSSRPVKVIESQLYNNNSSNFVTQVRCFLAMSILHFRDQRYVFIGGSLIVIYVCSTSLPKLHVYLSMYMPWRIAFGGYIDASHAGLVVDYPYRLKVMEQPSFQ